MSKVLVIFGVTGQQGGSVLSHVLNDVELSKQYSIRAITRNSSSHKALELKKVGVDVVEADFAHTSSLRNGLEGAHTVFAMTAPTFGPDAKVLEVTQGKALADAAVAEGVQYIIFSTLPHANIISGGKYKVNGFDAKAEVQAYIQTLPVKSAFFAAGSFMQNWQGVMLPRSAGNGTYVIGRHVSPQTQLPLIDAAGDTGKFVGAILAEPEKYEGKTFCAATSLYSMEQIAQIISKSSGKTVRYKQIPKETLLQSLPPWGAQLIEMMLYQQDFGYYGPGTKDAVAWAAENARGKVRSFEEYLAENPLPLQ